MSANVFTSVGVYMRITPTEQRYIKSCRRHFGATNTKFCPECGLMIENISATEHYIREFFDETTTFFLFNNLYYIALLRPAETIDVCDRYSMINLQPDIELNSIIESFHEMQKDLVDNLLSSEHVKDVKLEFGVITEWS